MDFNFEAEKVFLEYHEQSNSKYSRRLKYVFSELLSNFQALKSQEHA